MRLEETSWDFWEHLDAAKSNQRGLNMLVSVAVVVGICGI